MCKEAKLKLYQKHLNETYIRLIEKSNNYRFEDESVSDFAAFKAMKIKNKLNKIYFLDRKMSL